jgi:hypothetical protein
MTIMTCLMGLVQRYLHLRIVVAWHACRLRDLAGRPRALAGHMGLQLWRRQGRKQGSGSHVCIMNVRSRRAQRRCKPVKRSVKRSNIKEAYGEDVWSTTGLCKGVELSPNKDVTFIQAIAYSSNQEVETCELGTLPAQPIAVC